MSKEVYVIICEGLHGIDTNTFKVEGVFESQQDALDSFSKNGPANCYWRRTYIETTDYLEGAPQR